MPQRPAAPDDAGSAPVRDGSEGVETAAQGAPDEVQERGAFAFGSCAKCGWQGPGRRSRERARHDLAHHLDSPPEHAEQVRVAELPH